MEIACSFVTTPISPIPGKAPNGTAAPIWSKGWRIAAPATRHAMRWVLNATARSLPAAMSTTGTPMRSTISRHAPVPWDADALFAYLRDGWHPDHGTARGPMAEVVSNLSSVPSSDVRAIAVYMAGVSANADAGSQTPGRGRAGASQIICSTRPPEANAAGASIYAAACASCHASGRPLPYGGVNLALSTAIASPDPRNLANIVLSGVQAGRRRTQPDHARLCRQHDRCAGFGAVELSARAVQQPAAMVRR